jgi:F-type H+-transporting ATPase subunit b
MQIFKEFGVNPVLLVAQIINFLIILVVLKKFMYKPVLQMMKKREAEIKKGLDDSQKAEEKLKEAEEREKQIIQKAQEKAEKIVGDAKLQASELVAESELNAKAASEKILAEAEAKISQETSEAEEKLTKNIGKIAIALLEKSLVGVFGSKEQKTILKKAELQLQRIKP